jgi:hypothetical protein
MVGGPPPGIDRAVAGQVTAVNSTTREGCGGAVAKNGSFTLYLSPGTYRVTGHCPQVNDGQSECTSLTPVVARRDIDGIRVVCSIR